MSNDRPLYDALGVDPRCSADQLKQAWRDQARQLHPDRNPGDAVAASRFRSVRAAWEVLGNPERRALYDEFGEDATSLFFDPITARASRKTGREWSLDARTDTIKRYATTRGEDYRVSLHLSPLEAARGGWFEVFVRAPATCQACEGTGWRKSMRACSKCEGGTLPGIGPFGIPVAAGTVDGQLLIALGDGAHGRGVGAVPGDLRVTCRVPPVYLRHGSDERLAVPVPPELLHEGGEVRVPLTSGDSARVSVPAESEPGLLLRIEGKGTGGVDLYVQLDRLPDPIEVRATRVPLR